MKQKVTCSRRWLSRHATKVVLLVAAVMFMVPLAITKHQQNDIRDNQHDIARLATRNSRLLDRIQEERKERISTQMAINAYVCHENNKQDGLLAELLAYSLAASPPDSRLTDQQREGKEIFMAALIELEHKADCGALSAGIVPPPNEPKHQSNTLKPKNP